MSKEITYVKDVQEFRAKITELGEQFSKSWVYIYADNYLELKESCDIPDEPSRQWAQLTWYATDDLPEHIMVIDLNESDDWRRVTNLFGYEYCRDPDQLVFFKIAQA